MYDKILFPVTTSEVTEQLISFIHSFKFVNTKEIVMLNIVDSTDLYGDPVIINADKNLLLRWKDRLLFHGFDNIRARVEVGIPWEEIVDIAEREAFSVIYMGSHGSTFLKRVFLGSVTENVIHHSKKPVMIYKFSHDTGKSHDNIDNSAKDHLFSRILYATDFSEYSEKCIPYIESISPDKNKELFMLHIQDLRSLKHVSDEKLSQMDQVDHNRLLKLKEHFHNIGFNKTDSLLKTGYSIREILQIIDEIKPSLVVMGAKGKTNLKEMILGGVTESIVHKSTAPIFIIR